MQRTLRPRLWELNLVALPKDSRFIILLDDLAKIASSNISPKRVPISLVLSREEIPAIITAVLILFEILAMISLFFFLI